MSQLTQSMPYGIEKYIYTPYELNYDTSPSIQFAKNHNEFNRTVLRAQRVPKLIRKCLESILDKILHRS